MRFRHYELDQVVQRATKGPWIASGDGSSINHIVAPLANTNGSEEFYGAPLIAESMTANDVHFVCLARAVMGQIVEDMGRAVGIFERTCENELIAAVGSMRAATISTMFASENAAAYRRGLKDGEDRVMAQLRKLSGGPL
jgi:hypothetical protein